MITRAEICMVLLAHVEGPIAALWLLALAPLVGFLLIPRRCR